MPRKPTTAVTMGVRGIGKRPEAAGNAARGQPGAPTPAPRYVARLLGARGSCLCR